ncbi:MAG: hypothetical protein ABIY70_27450 [Capsulimonas sp.]|uniref:hypothetical protein n=2 Tax=Capsulimonas sp. TaxID=2494211 RepID=UPI003265FEA7
MRLYTVGRRSHFMMFIIPAIVWIGLSSGCGNRGASQTTTPSAASPTPEERARIQQAQQAAMAAAQEKARQQAVGQ